MKKHMALTKKMQVLPWALKQTNPLFLLYKKNLGRKNIKGPSTKGWGRRCSAGGAFDPPPPLLAKGAGRVLNV